AGVLPRAGVLCHVLVSGGGRTVLPGGDPPVRRDTAAADGAGRQADHGDDQASRGDEFRGTRYGVVPGREVPRGGAGPASRGGRRPAERRPPGPDGSGPVRVRLAQRGGRGVAAVARGDARVAMGGHVLKDREAGADPGDRISAQGAREEPEL